MTDIKETIERLEGLYEESKARERAVKYDPNAHARDISAFKAAVYNAFPTLITAFKELEGERDRLREALVRADSALRPFAVAARHFNPHAHDDDWKLKAGDGRIGDLSVGHLREAFRAREALESRAMRTGADEREMLRSALKKLANEASGLRAFEHEVRQAISNTNWECLQLRVDEARKALEPKP